MHQHGNVQYLQLFCCVGIKAKRGEISNNKHKFKCTTNKRQKKEEEQKKTKLGKKRKVPCLHILFVKTFGYQIK
jgi:hypothetical protein